MHGMAGHAGLSKDFFHEKLQEIIDTIDTKRLDLDTALLQQYCSYTGYDYQLYQARDLVPVGFLMTFTSSVFSEMFLSLFAACSALIKGIIHTSSKVELFAPFSLSCKEYQTKLEIKKIEDKVGRKGEYLVIDLEVVVLDVHGVKVASDVHQFFLRI